jgi:hypothetical protein
MGKSPEWRLELLGSFSFITIHNAITSINSLTIIIKQHVMFFFFFYLTLDYIRLHDDIRK